MLKALTAITLLAGIVIAILGAVFAGIALVIVGDVLVVIGVILFILLKRTSVPTVQSPD